MNIKTVYIEIINRCNLNCITCYNRSGLNRETRELSIENIKNIISIFSRYGANRFLFSGGEPSLHSEFDALIDLIYEHPEYSFGFVTNGTSKNQRFIDLLNHAPNLTLQISLDGSCEEENRKTRGAGHFDTVIDFAKKINNPHMKPLLKMVVSQGNLSDVENFYRLALSLNCIPEFAFIYKSGNGAHEWESKKLSAQSKIKVLKLIDKLNTEHQTDAFLPLCTSSCPFIKSADNLSLCIKVDGSVQPCQALYDERFSIGNVFSFDEKEFSENVSRILSMAKQRSKADFGCSKCMLKDVCGRGCMAEAFYLTEDPLGSDDACLYRKLQFIDYNLKKQQEQMK